MLSSNLSELHDKIEEGGFSLRLGGERVGGLEQVLHRDPLAQAMVETFLPH